MEERKGVRTIIEAAMELLVARGRTDVRFLLFGNKHNESEVYEQMYRGSSAEEYITFGGYRADLPKIFPCCFVGVIASSGWDSFPRTSLEFAASGLPLIVSELGGLPECIEANETGFLFPPQDDVALANRIEQLLESPSRASEMGAASRARCEREYSLEKQALRLGEVFRRRLRY
jgi:glycosyltransferase involved in cell wall biosynthesis